MFSQASVCSKEGRGGVRLPGKVCPHGGLPGLGGSPSPQYQTPSPPPRTRHLPPDQTPTPLPPGPGTYPRPPRDQTPTTPHPQLRSMRGRYASYWNAYLFYFESMRSVWGVSGMRQQEKSCVQSSLPLCQELLVCERDRSAIYVYVLSNVGSGIFLRRRSQLPQWVCKTITLQCYFTPRPK